MSDLHSPPKTVDRTRASQRLTRRGLIGLAAVAIVGGGVFAGAWFNVTAQAEGTGLMSAADAHAAAMRKDMVLVDIRTPDEWRMTGLGAGALPLDMRRPDFIEALRALVADDLAAPIAVICARGVRSRGMRARLQDAGFTRIYDVPEGMMGSGAGPGWLRGGLPVVAYTD